MERIDRYDVLALVREDGPLAVYLARDTMFGCDVSLETAPVDAVDAVSSLRREARAKRDASADVDVRVFEDLDRGLFCVAVRRSVRPARPDGTPAPSPTFHTLPRVTPFLLVGAAVLACGVAVGATVFMSHPRRQIAPFDVDATASAAAPSSVVVTWEGCPPTTVALGDGCIDRSPMLRADCPACDACALDGERACGTRAEAEKACARQGGALPSEAQWGQGKAAGMRVDESVEWRSDVASNGDVSPSNAAFRCFHPSDTTP